ncbi:MAG TPA: hypothetical protein PKY81_02615 [bacterium]|nr:hypothetical protein [bacterium]
MNKLFLKSLIFFLLIIIGFSSCSKRKLVKERTTEKESVIEEKTVITE